ncbi:uncharacterized protein LOC136087442 [Hydra vulgaris]|uniref:Uncharacterized protein LOC136087442 n=1 Tax=Hydra vulgaris TaxID=6087 RepID=A0ABM4CWH6_HYDVU
MLLTACQRYIFERHVTHFWELYPSSHTSGPENKLFKLLKNHWNDLDTENQDLKRLSTPVDSWINEQRLSAIQFCRYIISTKVFKKDGKFRKDYQELAKLTLMVLSHTDRFKLHNPGTTNHARFMGKSLFYLKLFLLMEKIPEINEESKDEITEMTKFLSIFYTEWFLRAELSSTAPTQDTKRYWQMKRYYSHILSIFSHYSNCRSADQKCKERSNMAKRLFGLKRPSIEEYSLERQVLDKDILKNLNFSQDEPSSLVPLVTEKSWLIFDMVGHGKAEVQWMKLPAEYWILNDFYQEFETAIMNLDVVNDCSERTVKLVQQLVNKAHSEEKRQDTFLFTHVYKRNRNGRKKLDHAKAALNTII